MFSILLSIIHSPVTFTEFLLSFLTHHYQEKIALNAHSIAKVYNVQEKIWSDFLQGHSRHSDHSILYSEFYNNSQTADLCIVLPSVGGEGSRIFVHKAVLMANSGVLRRLIEELLERGTKTPCENQRAHQWGEMRLSISDNNRHEPFIEWTVPREHAEHIPSMMQFLYSGMLPQGTDSFFSRIFHTSLSIQHLRMAHVYEIPLLQTEARRNLWIALKTLKVDRVELLKTCLEIQDIVMLNRLKHYLKVDDFPDLFEAFSWDEMMRLLDSSLFAFTDEELFQKIQWHADVNQIAVEDQRRMMEYVRLPLLSAHTLCVDIPAMMQKNPSILEKDRLIRALEYQAKQPDSTYQWMRDMGCIIKYRRCGYVEPVAVKGIPLSKQVHQYTCRQPKFLCVKGQEDTVLLRNGRREVIMLGSPSIVVIPIPDGIVRHTIKVHITCSDSRSFNSIFNALSTDVGYMDSGTPVSVIHSTQITGLEKSYQWKTNTTATLEMDRRREAVSLYSRFGVKLGESEYARPRLSSNEQRCWIFRCAAEGTKVTLLECE